MELMLRIGTRGSPLAIAQAEEVAARLRETEPRLSGPGALSLVPIQTTGDKVQDRSLQQIGGKGLFVKEIERALLSRNVDVAVHSMKDVEPTIAENTFFGAFLPRANAQDCLVPPGDVHALREGWNEFASAASVFASPPPGSRDHSGARER
jgi:hydroxymethylbilane synthase